MSKEESIGIVDYGGGNIRSLVKAVETLGGAPELITSPSGFEGVDRLLFPGQGAFGDCMRQLRSRRLVDPLRAWIADDRPFFGICVGYQLLFEGSEESPGEAGLGVLEGLVTRFPAGPLKVPHMGWNSAALTHPEGTFWKGLGNAPYFYFVHSYFPDPRDHAVVAATTDYGLPFASAVERGSMIATQFHPEKSQRAGMRLLANFLGAQAPA
ncbi:MAG: imidazole glycerol phosphate synthase subunit HisH [Akkermansiaceae bacterium]|nr:imidazole glycerol phosphate synthase subunit HisH [Akkermansiaceae bacterium]